MIRTGIKDVPLNDYALSILKDAEWFVQNENYKKVILGYNNHHNKKDQDYFTGDEYFKTIKDMGTKHDGFPEVIVAHSFSYHNLKYANNVDSHKINGELQEHLIGLIGKIQQELCLRRNALWAIYPPGGYISWHNNANAPAYNIVFTYSETGDGEWRHWDTHKNEFVVIPDKKGWQCKAGYFGAYADPKETLLYHTAKNGESGLRMTIAFTLSKDEMSIGLQDDIIEDISL
jgi:hypothetical protein